MDSPVFPAAGRQAREWLPTLNTYRAPSVLRSSIEIGVSVVPFLSLWVAAWFSMSWSYVVSLLFGIVASGFLVRIFMIQHDCGHGAFFPRRLTNDLVGRAMSVLTFTPYDDWRRSHAVHHSTSGNLDRRGIGDITTLTVSEYLARPRWRRLAYRLYRHPLVMFGIGPAYLFLLQNRLPAVGAKDWRSWLSPMATNSAIAVISGVVIWLIGIWPFLVVQVPIILVAASIGVWLFYVQHQFEETVWAQDSEWSAHEAALHGSSHYDLPLILRWFTANIGVHHVHHMCSRIPYYRLNCVLKDHPQLRDVGRITFIESLLCVRLALWDAAERRLISFRELRDRQTI